jgi:hypothetical protein
MMPNPKKSRNEGFWPIEYFFLSKLVSSANMSVKAQENLTTYFNGVVKSCDDILPDLKGFMSSFPQEVEAKKATVNNFISLLESKNNFDSINPKWRDINWDNFASICETSEKIDPNLYACVKIEWYITGERDDQKKGISIQKGVVTKNLEQMTNLKSIVTRIMRKIFINKS